MRFTRRILAGPSVLEGNSAEASIMKRKSANLAHRSVKYTQRSDRDYCGQVVSAAGTPRGRLAVFRRLVRG
jgi:hypothetical protein